MPYDYQSDASLDDSTNRVMWWGGVLMLALVALFPLYRWVEPSNRDEAREEQLGSLQEQGSELWSISCSSCHGLAGEGVTAPALNSTQFLQSANNQQIELLIAVGVPGSAMSAYSQDFAGPLTSEQIRAVTLFMMARNTRFPFWGRWRDTAG